MDISENTRGNFIRVIIDAERPVTLDDTTNLSKKLRNDDEMDIRFPDGFRLEVTTPGLDKALESPFQFRKNIDRKLKITYSNGDGTQTITGTLIDANDTCVYIKESGQEFSLRYDQINSAKVLISFNYTLGGILVNRELIEVFSEIAREKNVERSELATILEDLFLYVIEKEYGDSSNCSCIVNLDKGEIEIYAEKTIVDEIDDYKVEITLAEAIAKEPDAADLEVGDVFV